MTDVHTFFTLSQVFAFGIILYELFTAAHVYKGESGSSVVTSLFQYRFQLLKFWPCCHACCSGYDSPSFIL